MRTAGAGGTDVGTPRVGGRRGASLLSPAVARDLAVPFPLRIIRSLRDRRVDEALGLCGRMRESQVLLHDFFAESCTLLWSWVVERLGEDALEPMFRSVFEHSARRQTFTLGDCLPPRPAMVVLAGIWRAHSCFGAGEHPGRFQVLEDEEKFTIRLDPCGSGARLWRKGWYEPGRGGRLIESERPWTFLRRGLPTYCVHCAFLNEILPWETVGYPLLPVDPLSGPGDVCTWYLYKDPARIPDRFYRRAGLTRRKLSGRGTRGGRLFSDRELLDLARPATDRIRERVEAGDLRGAIALCRGVRDEWLFLHDLYVHMLCATLTFIAGRAGEAGLEEALTRQVDKGAGGRMVSGWLEMPGAARVEFLADRLFGADACNGAGRPAARFSIAESEDTVDFVLDPCGSGGRLWRAGAYGPMSRSRRWSESWVDRLSRFACETLPASLLERGLPFGRRLVMERKPYGLGVTRQAHPWSFGRAGLPYFCCQCGMLQRLLGDACLRIQPPRHRNAPCVWRIRKRGAGADLLSGTAPGP